MDVFLLGCDARLTQLLAATFGPRGHRLVTTRHPEPSHGALVLGFDVPTGDRVRTLRHVWAGDDGLLAWLATAQGSVGDGLLASVLGRRLRAPPWGTRPHGVALRRVQDLRFEHVLTLERLVVGAVTAPTDATTRRTMWTA